MPKFKFNPTPLKDILKEYAEARETDIPDAVLMHSRLLCVELARRTQPFGNSAVAGETRVEIDIGKVINTEDDLLKRINKLSNEKTKAALLRLLKAGDMATIGKILKSSIAKLAPFNFPSVHKAQRNKRTGRVVGRPSEYYVADDAALKNYIGTIQHRVGLSKAGWAEAAEAIPKHNSLRNFPAFVTRNMDQGNGKAVDKTGNKAEPTVELHNITPWASEIITTGDQVQATQVVIAKMKKQMEKIFEARAKQA